MSLYKYFVTFLVYCFIFLKLRTMIAVPYCLVAHRAKTKDAFLAGSSLYCCITCATKKK